MAKKKDRSKQSMVDPSTLAPRDAKVPELLQVIIETPKGSRNKYGFDGKQRIFALTKVLPAGMAFPYDFGFIPSTEAEDGDGTDVLVLMDEPAFPGCLLKCRVIGVIEGVQLKGKKKTRNDRIVAVEQENHSYAKVHHINELGTKFLQELETFFVNYHQMIGLKYKIVDVRGPKEAWRRVKAGIAAVK
jgi:inorganic pyrophosphatase